MPFDQCVKYRAIAKFLQGEVSSKSTFVSKKDGQETEKYASRYKQSASCVLMIERQERPDGSVTETLYGANPKYGFVLLRVPGKDDWLVQNLFLGEPAKVTYADMDLRQHVLNKLSSAYPHEIALGTMAITKSRRIDSEEGGEVVVLEYEGSTQNPKSEEKGKLTFSPKRELAMIRCESTDRADSSNSKVVHEYSGKLAGFARISKTTVAVSIQESDGTTTTVKTVTDYDLRYDETVPDVEFTLSAFGIAEPKGVTWDRPAQRGWMWWGLAGIGLVAVGYSAHRWRQQQGTAKASV